MENVAVRNGVYMGITLVILNFILYFISIDALLMAGWIGFIVYIVFMVMAVREERSAQGGLMSFGEGFKSAFLTFAIGSLISVVFSYLLYNFIDPSIVDEIKDITAEQMEKVGEMMGGGSDFEDQLEKAVDEINYTLPTMLMGYLFSLIFPGAIIAAILGLIFRKSEANPLV